MTFSSRRIVALALAVLCAPVGALAKGSHSSEQKIDKALRASVHSGGREDVIVTTDPACGDQVLKALTAHGNRVRRSHPSINAFVVSMSGEDVLELAKHPCVVAESADAPVAVTAKPVETVAQNKAANRTAKSGNPSSTLRDTLGLPHVATPDTVTGQGVGVAVIDSGIAPTDDFTGRITAFYDFTRGGIATAPFDEFGHGTHIAGLIGSSGKLTNGEFQGVAPDVRFVGLKVLNNRGQGKTSDVIAALEFVTANKAALRVDVVNLSLGHEIFAPAKYDPLVQAVERAVASGLIVVTSAGNFGQRKTVGYTGVTSPGNAPSALTVGAAATANTTTRLDDVVASYSSRGPTWFDAYAKPDVVAPGDRLLSDAASNSYLYGVLVNNRMKVSGKQTFLELSGTSMAAAVTSGVVALMVQQHNQAFFHRQPRLTANLVKAWLQFTAVPVNGFDRFTQGTGQINAAGALSLARAADTSVAPTNWWLRSWVVPYSEIGGAIYGWSQNIIWGDDLLGGYVAYVSSTAWDDNIVWGTADDNIVWGTAAYLLDDNIVWGTASVWAANLVWKDRVIGQLDGDNIVWGTYDDNIVWGTLTEDNIVWGTWDGDNIVWGTSDDDNIVWGTADDNIVWGTLDDLDNIVWGTAVLAGGN